MKNKIINHIKKYKYEYLLSIISCFLSFLVMIQLGYNYTLGSDDLSYVNSGIRFMETGKIGIHGYYQTAQIMPGMPIFIAMIAKIVGTGSLLWLTLKIIWIIIATLSVLGLYKIIRIFSNNIISFLVTLLLFTADYLWMNNIILTETPFHFCFIYLIYYSLLLSKNQKWSYFWKIVIFYILGIMIRPNIGIYPIFLFVYLLIKKYDFKLLIKQGFIALAITLVVLTPWTIRNYKIFNRFIPLTYGVGNPLLLGTYQGVGYPKDDELDYKTNVDQKISKTMLSYAIGYASKETTALRQYYALEYDGVKAKYRMKEWWKRNPKSMIKSYFILKPWGLIDNTFYWREVLHIKRNVNLYIRRFDLLLSLISIILILIFKKYRAELLLLLSTYISQIALYSYTFSFDRYAQCLFFLRFIIIGIGLQLFYNKYKERKKQNESIIK